MSLNLDRSAWRRVKLGDVVRNVNEYFDPARDGEMPYVAGPHIDSGSALVSRWGITSDDAFPPTFKRMFQDGDVLLHSRGVEKIASVDRRGVTGEKLFVLRTTDPEQLDQRFLVWLLRSPQAATYYRANFSGSVNKFLNWTPLAAFEFDLPPLSDQRRIADLLWAMEQTLRASGTEQEALSRLRDAVFQQALAQVKGTFMNVEDLLTQGPRNGLSLSAQDSNAGFPTVTLGAVRDGELRPAGNLKWVDTTEATVNPFLIRPGEFFVVRGNGNREFVARGGLAVAGTIPEGCFYPDLLIRLRFDPSVVITEFAALQWNSTESHNSLLRKAKTTNGTYKINGKDIKSHKLKIPTIADQEAILAHVTEVAATEQTLRERRAHLQALKSSTVRALLEECE